MALQDREIPLPTPRNLTLHWVKRNDATSLAASLESRDWANWRAWIAPEAGSLKHLRSRVRDEFGFPKSEMYTQAYWNEGRAMGKQRGPEPKASGTYAAAVAGLSAPGQYPRAENDGDSHDGDAEKACAETDVVGNKPDNWRRAQEAESHEPGHDGEPGPVLQPG